MNIKQVMVLSLILLLMLMPIALAADGDFKIPSVVKDITVNDDGSTLIIEEITYDIEGSVNGVYRNIPLNDRQSIRNISVETPGYYNKLDIDRNTLSTDIKVWLYTDPAKTQKVNNEKVKVIFHYKINKGVKVYNDIAELQYMTWGADWDSKVDHMESTIHIPGSNDNIEYWNNPEDNVVSSQWTSSDTLTTKLDNIDAHTSFEQRILMPKSYIKDTTYAQVINKDAKEIIEQDQMEYQAEQNKKKIFNYAFWSIIGILLILPFGIYGFFGREPKIDYNAEYEYDLPTDATIIQVNSLLDGEINQITDNAMYATLLDLIDKKYFKIKVNDKDSTIIRQTNKDTSNLQKHEKSLIEFLSSFADENGDISIGYVGRRAHRAKYLSFRKDWRKQAAAQTPDTWIKEYFDNKGSKLLMYLAGIYALAFFGLFVCMFFFAEYMNVMMGYTAPLLIFGSVILFALPYSIAGRWTPKGKEFHDKWKNFEKYIKDYSLIEEKPPASVQLWGRYIIYASALGCADEVTKNMKKYFKSVEIDDSLDIDTVPSFAYYNGFSHVESSFNTLGQSESSDSSGSDIGSSGSGGFGGGGGGTF